MNERIKGTLLTFPIISVGGILIYSSLKLRQSLDNNLVTTLYLTGAVILSIGLAVLDVKYDTKEVKNDSNADKK